VSPVGPLQSITTRERRVGIVAPRGKENTQTNGARILFSGLFFPFTKTASCGMASLVYLLQEVLSLSCFSSLGLLSAFGDAGSGCCCLGPVHRQVCGGSLFLVRGGGKMGRIWVLSSLVGSTAVRASADAAAAAVAFGFSPPSESFDPLDSHSGRLRARLGGLEGLAQDDLRRVGWCLSLSLSLSSILAPHRHRRKRSSQTSGD